ncbi:MAG: MBL fold metallo-hydrolase [Erysipelotrichaceae bacterium]|nr:MBL fold metallo-hydrolase [Erysipelotrichaceae bacterium]
MKVVVLGSGSKGNSTYVETKNTKVLIDTGLSMLQVKSRLKNQGIELGSLDAVFITHEHTDHIKELVSILTKTSATLYIEENTYNEANRRLRGNLVNFPKVFIKPDTKYNINDLSVVPMRLSHDTSYCMGYLMKQLDVDSNNTFASITDTGYIDKKYYKILSYINTILIESNHDPEMLLNSGRPWMLINRILSNQGHMSNEQCIKHLKDFISDNNKNIILGHISEECNDYDLAYNECSQAFNNNPPFNLSVAYQYTEHPMVLIGEEDD